MSLKNFQAYKMATEFYKQCKSLKLERHLKDQLNRASSSVSLNLAEGSGKSTIKDQQRFYGISLGSLRESQAILELAEIQNRDLFLLMDKLGGCIYRLIHPKNRSTS